MPLESDYLRSIKPRTRSQLVSYCDELAHAQVRQWGRAEYFARCIPTRRREPVRMIQVWAVSDDKDGRHDAMPSVGGVGRELQRRAAELIEVDADLLSRNIQELLTAFEGLASSLSAAYYIDEIEVGMTVNAKGGVALLGTLEAGVEAGIKVKLKPQQKR
jgi:hypothetical protein